VIDLCEITRSPPPSFFITPRRFFASYTFARIHVPSVLFTIRHGGNVAHYDSVAYLKPRVIQLRAHRICSVSWKPGRFGANESKETSGSVTSRSLLNCKRDRQVERNRERERERERGEKEFEELLGGAEQRDGQKG